MSLCLFSLSCRASSLIRRTVEQSGKQIPSSDPERSRNLFPFCILTLYFCSVVTYLQYYRPVQLSSPFPLGILQIGDPARMEMDPKEDRELVADQFEDRHKWTQSDLMLRLNQILKQLSTRTSACVRTPTPEKFNIGGDFRRWHIQTKIYLRNFPQDRWADVILSLLNGEALYLAFELDILHSEVSENTFKHLHRCYESSKTNRHQTS